MTTTQVGAAGEGEGEAGFFYCILVRQGRDIHPTWVKLFPETLSNRLRGFCSTRAKSEEDFDSY